MQKAWWDDVPADESGDRVTIEIEAPPIFNHPCGFIRLRERHRVKAPSVRYGKAAQQENA